MYEESDQTEINQICSRHIAEQVNLKWLLSATDSTGVASLKGITLNSRMLDVVRMSPLEWGKRMSMSLSLSVCFDSFFFSEVKINGDTFKSHDDLSCDAGDCVELQMSVANSLPNCLKDVTLSVQFYQDYNNGTLNYRTDARLAVSGASK